VSVIVRPIADEEVAAAVAILTAGSLTPDDEHPERLERYVHAVHACRSEGGEILVAVDGADVVGVCQLLIFTHLQHTGERCAELETVHVREDRRGHGIGAAMLEEAERRARELGCYRIQLTSRAARLDAHRFYLSNGYDQSHLGFKKSLR